MLLAFSFYFLKWILLLFFKTVFSRLLWLCAVRVLWGNLPSKERIIQHGYILNNSVSSFSFSNSASWREMNEPSDYIGKNRSKLTNPVWIPTGHYRGRNNRNPALVASNSQRRVENPSLCNEGRACNNVRSQAPCSHWDFKLDNQVVYRLCSFRVFVLECTWLGLLPEEGFRFRNLSQGSYLSLVIYCNLFIAHSSPVLSLYRNTSLLLWSFEFL